MMVCVEQTRGLIIDTIQTRHICAGGESFDLISDAALRHHFSRRWEELPIVDAPRAFSATPPC